jgi:hypothetical protein
VPLPARLDQSPRRRLVAALIAAGLVASAVTIYVLRLDHVAGLIGDDAWYVVLAKAIAEGDGPRLIGSAGLHVLSPVYPPGFPALLSLIFLVSPAYPGNLLLLKGVSVTAMIGAGVLTYRYARRCRGCSPAIAAAVAFGTVITPSLVFLATSTLMSEAVFLFVELAAVLAIERAAAAGAGRASRWAMLAGALAGATMLVRTAGVAVVAAGVLYLVGTRRWRRAVPFVAASVVCVLPWTVYAHRHAATGAERADLGGVMAVDYSTWFWTREAGRVNARRVDIGALPGRLARNVTNIAFRDMGGIFVPVLFRSAGESGLETVGLGPPEDGRVPSMGSATGTQIASLVLTLVAVLGFVVACRRRLTVAEPLTVLSIGMIVLWPFWTFRFVLPLAPFLLGYLVTGVETLGAAAARSRPPAAVASVSASTARIFLFVLIGLNVLDHARYIAQPHENARGGTWQAQGDDTEAIMAWVRRHAEPGSVIAAYNPALVYLLTGHQTVAIDSFGDRWSRWRRLGVRYLVCLSDAQPMEDSRRSALRFKLPDKNLWVVELWPADGGAASSVASTTHMPDRDVRNNTR